MIAMASRVKSSAMLKKTKSQPTLYFYAVADFVPNDSMIGALHLRRGDEVEVLKRDPTGWWCVAAKDRTGWAPSTFLNVCPNAVIADTPTIAVDDADKSQPFKDIDEEDNGYLTLKRNAPSLSEERNNVRLSCGERRDSADHDDVDEPISEENYLQLEGTGLCIVNRSGVAVDEEGYVKITAVPLPLPAMSNAQRFTSTGSSVDSEGCHSPTPSNSPIGDNSPFPPSPKREVHPNCPAVPPRRLPPQPLHKARSRENLFEGSSPQLKGNAAVHRHIIEKRQTEGHISSPKFQRSSTEPLIANSVHPVNALRTLMDGEIVPEDEPFCLPQKAPTQQIHLSNKGSVQVPASRTPPRKPRRCFSDETVTLRTPHINPEADRPYSSIPTSRKVDSHVVTIGNMPWFHGRLSRQKAENRLLKCNVEVGDFLVRESESQPGNYTMSVRNITSETLHFKITVLNGGEKFAMENTLFSSIEKIVEFYKTHDIFETGGQRMKLNNPVKKREAVR